MNWQKFPFVRFTFALIVGILIGPHLSFNTTNFFICSLSGSFLFYILSWLIQRKKWKLALKPFLGMLSVAILIQFGIVIMHLQDDRASSNHLVQAKTNGITAFEGILIEPPIPKERSYKTILKVDRIFQGDGWKKITGNVLLYLQKTNKMHALKYGDRILISGRINPTHSASNPDEFDYKTYLARKNIFHQAYAKETNIFLMGSDVPYTSLLKSAALKSRHFLDKQLAKEFKNKREEGIALALILGVKDDLDNHIRNTYSEVGAMHILAVSGLHVGLIYQILAWILGVFKLERKKNGRIIQAFILVLAIWAYAFITGLSPSVLRAATMFSFIIVGQSFKRSASIYNTLALSAFILLCFNSNLLYEIGFQLSYLAVLGIVYLQPKIYELWDVKWNWLDRIWMISSVSIAAQIATGPVSLYYFHQFPNYFLLSNLLAIPAATGILGLGLIKIICAWIPYVSSILTWLLEKLIWITNESMILITDLPHAVTKNLELTFPQMIISYAITIAFLLFIYHRKLRYFSCAVLGSLAILGIWLTNYVSENAAHEIIVYNVKGDSAIGFRQGHDLSFVYSNGLWNKKNKMKFNILNHWQTRHIHNVSSHALEDSNYVHKHLAIDRIGENHLIVWKGKRVFLINKPFLLQSPNALPYFDLVILRNNVKMNEQSMNLLNYGKLILDSSCDKWYVDQYPAWISKKTTFVTQVKGALILNASSL